MATRWLVDSEANATLWRELSDLPLRLADGPGRAVVDLGGGNGNFVAPLRARGVRLVSADVDLPSLRRALPSVEPVASTLLRMPFRNGAFDAAAGRAVLHHVPDDLDGALREVRRIVKPGGLLLVQEPTDGNPVANLARRRFPTERHDPHERPLPAGAYVDAVRRHFELLEVRPAFLTSYLLPHLVGRIPEGRRGPARALTRLSFRFDERLLRGLPRLRDRAAYVSILARRPRRPTPLEQPL